MTALLNSAESGDVLSQANLARIHENHRQIAETQQLLSPGREAASLHRSEAFRWWTRAAAQGSPKAQQNLALCYESGDGVPRDAVAALMWYLLCEPRLHGDDVDSMRKGRIRLARTMAPSDVRDATQRAAVWRPRIETSAPVSG